MTNSSICMPTRISKSRAVVFLSALICGEAMASSAASTMIQLLKLTWRKYLAWKSSCSKQVVPKTTDENNSPTSAPWSREFSVLLHPAGADSHFASLLRDLVVQQRHHKQLP